MGSNINNNNFKPEPDFSRYDKSYALSGKIMLSAIVILFFVVILMVCLHLYARWYLLRARRRNLRRNRHRRNHLVFHADSATATAAATRGLDPAVLNSLPVFVYSTKTNPESDPDPVLECAVCLSEFEENETGRRLPKCNHSFHTECIDMWFHSHSTCPLCRSPVEPGPDPEIRTEVCIVVSESEGVEPGRGTSSGLCPDCDHSSSSMASSSFGARRKPFELVGVSIEVPRRNESFGRVEDESGCNTPAGQTTSFRSPMGRMLSFKRILSRERRGVSSPSSTPGCSGVNELDIERGKDPTQ